MTASSRSPRPTPDFDPEHFLTGAKAAYEMIVTAFAEGDRATLKNLLAPDVYEGFVAAIAERESAAAEGGADLRRHRGGEDDRRPSSTAARRASRCASSPS